MPPKHKVDAETQLTFLPPPMPDADLALKGLAKRVIEGGYVLERLDAIPSQGEPLVSPETAEDIARLAAERESLDAFTREARSRNTVTRISNQLYSKYGDPDFKDSTDPIAAALNERKSSSQAAASGLKLASKGAFARSRGYKTHTGETDKIDRAGKKVLDKEGNTVKITDILTEDPADQLRFNIEYSEYRQAFLFKKQLITRRKSEIDDQIKTLLPSGSPPSTT